VKNLDVIIISWNGAAETLSCLESFQSWGCPPRHVWVVDNASKDRGEMARAERYPFVTIIDSPENRGFAGGNNLAIRRIMEGGGDGFVLLINNDAFLEEKDAALLMAVLEADQRLGLTGPAIGNQTGRSLTWIGGGRDISRYLDSHIYLPTGPGGPGEKEPPHLVDYLPGTAVCIRRRLFTLIGLFDEDYFFGGEMADFCERARAAGFQSAVHYRAVALHRLDRSSAIRENLHIYYILRNRFLFVRKFRRGEKGRLMAFWCGVGVFLAAAALLKGQTRRFRAIGLALGDALVGRYGNQNRRILQGSGPS
jgi:GT2 family glycosyltransferase